MTSSCHDTFGRRNVIDAAALNFFIRKLNDKIEKHRDEIVRVEQDTDGAEVVLVSYGSVLRCAQAAVEAGRAERLPLGWFKMATIWPFPDKEIAAWRPGPSTCSSWKTIWGRSSTTSRPRLWGGPR